MWSRINPSLYSVCFTGKAQGIPRCSKCASIDHMVRDCSFSAKSDLERTLEVVFAACTAKSNPGTPGESAGNHSQEICRRWNDMRCTFANCRYRHTCQGCGGNHHKLYAAGPSSLSLVNKQETNVLGRGCSNLLGCMNIF